MSTIKKLTSFALHQAIVSAWPEQKHQGAYAIPALLDGMYDIIHPPPISRCQTDHPLQSGIREIKRDIFDLNVSSRACARLLGRGAHINQDVICAVPLLSDDLVRRSYEP